MRIQSNSRGALRINSVLTGLSSTQLADLLMELARPWGAALEGRRAMRRGHDHPRGGGRYYDLSVCDRLVITLASLRHGITHSVLASLWDVDRSTITRAVGEVRPLLAAMGFSVEPGLRLRTLADAFAYLEATGQQGRLDGTDIRVRRPPAGKPGRKQFISGKHRLNTVKATTLCDESERLIWVGAWRGGRVHDQTAIASEGIDDLLDQFPSVTILVDAGYRGLAKRHPAQVIAPPPKPKKDATVAELESYEVTRHDQSSRRIGIEHVSAHLKIARGLQRWTGRREQLPEVGDAWAAVLTYRQRRA